MEEPTRRRLLAAAAAGVTTLAGCSNDGGTDAAASTATRPSATGSTRAGTATTAGATDTEQSGGVGQSTPGATAWPSWRGTAGNTGLSTTGGPTPDATAAYTATLRDGLAVSERAPVVGPDAVYAIGRAAAPYDHSPPKFACHVYAFSREDGSELWRRTVEAGEGEAYHRLALEHNLCLGPDSLYVTWQASADEVPVQRFARLSREDGTESWRTTFEAVPARCLQPVVRDGRLHAFVKGRLVALSTADGSELWRTPVRYYSQSVPSVGRDATAVYHSAAEGAPRGLTVFETADGSVRWQREFTESKLPFPAVVGDTVFLTDGSSRGPWGLRPAIEGGDYPRRKIHALSLADGSTRWTHTYDTDAIYEAATAGGTSSVTVTEDHVYYALGFWSTSELLGPSAGEAERERVQSNLYHGPNVVALDRADGSVAWRATVGSQARAFQPLVAGPDHLYALYRGVEAADERSRVYVLDRTNGDLRGSFGPVETGQALSVAGGTAFTHRQGEILAWN